MHTDWNINKRQRLRFELSARTCYKLAHGTAPKDAVVVARVLRIEGDRDARRLAERIERRAMPLSHQAA